MLQQVLDVIDRFAERPFLIDLANNKIFNFTEFHQLVCNLARLLRQRGIQRGDRIAIILENSVEFAMLYFCCAYLGAVAVPINAQLHPREIDFIVNNSRAKMLIYSRATRSLVTSDCGRVESSLCLVPQWESDGNVLEPDAVSIDHLSAEHDDQWKPFAGVTAHDFLAITFTSGTTGTPKGVSHTIDSLLHNAMIFTRHVGLEPENRFYHILPMSYMAGFLNNILCPFLAGASVVLGRPFDARVALDFWKPIIRYGADSFWLVPTILAALLKIDRDSAGLEYCRKHVKTIFVGTAPLPLKIKKEFEKKYGVELFESYGLSELLIVTCNSHQFPRLQGSVGPVLPGVQLRIANERGESVQPEKDGAVWVRTSCTMAGYLNYQTLEPDCVSPADWFYTGDIGHVSAQGYLFITGREKDLIIRGGINVSPGAIEEVLLEQESVEQIAVVGLPHDFYGEEVVAAVKLKTGYELTGVRPFFDALCRENLNANSIPTTYVEVDQFPVSSTGKIQKMKLREVLSARLNRITMGASQI